MRVGGFQKSLINLLIYLNYDKYDVTLYLINKDGIFLDFVDKHVKIITNETYGAYCESYKVAVKRLIKLKKYALVLKRTYNLILSMIDKGIGAEFMANQIPAINEEYDVCVDYNGQYQNYYMINKINAKKKITYFHNDYSKWDKYKKADKKYYKFADAIITVSDECVASMKKYFPEYKEKIYCIENIITEETINLMSSVRENNELIPDDKFLICTVGRVCQDKGTDIAIDACKLLKEKIGDNFSWVWVGPGFNEEYKKQLRQNNVENNFLFVGSKVNPYYYMKNATIIAHTARFEGKAVSVEEALILHKPIVATEYSTVHNQIQNEVTGLIVGMNPMSVCNGIFKLYSNESYRLKMIENSKNICLGNSEQALLFQKVIEL